MFPKSPPSLFLSVKTVSTYRTRILEKMGMKTNADMTYYAIKNNLRAVKASGARSKRDRAGRQRLVQAERRILLIEDSAVLSRRLVDLLSEPGRVVRHGTGGDPVRGAVAPAGGAPTTCSWSTSSLPRATAWRSFVRSRQLYPPDAQPLIMVLTNYASDFVRDHCFAAGADYFLDKMRDISQLKAVVVGRPASLIQAPRGMLTRRVRAGARGRLDIEADRRARALAGACR